MVPLEVINDSWSFTHRFSIDEYVIVYGVCIRKKLMSLGSVGVPNRKQRFTLCVLKELYQHTFTREMCEHWSQFNHLKGL